MFKKLVMSAAILLTTSACATIIAGTDQTIQVSTNPSAMAQCSLKDSKMSYTVTTPGSVNVKRGDGPLNLNCKSAKMSGETIVSEELEPWFLGNILGGGLIGGGIDAASGAYQKYPQSIIVPMTER